MVKGGGGVDDDGAEVEDVVCALLVGDGVEGVIGAG